MPNARVAAILPFQIFDRQALLASLLDGTNLHAAELKQGEGMAGRDSGLTMEDRTSVFRPNKSVQPDSQGRQRD